jgi:hypothetical protein
MGGGAVVPLGFNIMVRNTTFIDIEPFDFYILHHITTLNPKKFICHHSEWNNTTAKWKIEQHHIKKNLI